MSLKAPEGSELTCFLFIYLFVPVLWNQFEVGRFLQKYRALLVLAPKQTEAGGDQTHRSYLTLSLLSVFVVSKQTWRHTDEDTCYE